VLRAIGTLLVCTLYGALGTAMVRFLYVSYQRIDAGFRRDSLTLDGLLHAPFDIQLFTIRGAAGGLVFGLLIVIAGLVGWLIWRIRRPEVAEAPGRDTNEILRADRERRAEEYLAGRES